MTAPKEAVALPPELRAAIDERVSAGDFASAEELVAEAVRYYLARHRPEDWEEYVKQEVAWSRRHAG
jgi:Arc/MetJ-type ribon-helix-helix transcriptional regulator